jgi:hypothetical protein
VRVSVIGDINSDGLNHLVVAPGSGWRAQVRIISGAFANVLREVTVFDPSFLGGVFVGLS